MSQTSYSINIPAWSYPGQIADIGTKRITTALAALAAISYGLLVVLDSTNTTGYGEICGKVPSSSADITTATKQLGCSLSDQARAQNPGVAAAQYPQFSAVPCMKGGRVAVIPESAVVAGNPVYVRWTTGDNGTVAGTFGGILDVTVVGNALLANAVWLDDAAGGSFAVLELNIV